MRTVTFVSTPEFDAFGPWIDEVPSADELPRLYADAGVAFGPDVTVLKVPRDIVRRDATPQMHLYDHLLVVGPDDLTIFSRVLDTYSRARIRYSDVAAITDSVDMLDGRLTLLSTGGDAFEVAYNGASRSTVDALVNRLTAPVAVATAPGVRRPPRAALGTDDLGRNDVGLVNAFRAERALTLFAAHGSRTVRRRSGGLVDLLRPMRLAGAVVGADSTRLVVLARREWLRRRNRPDLSSSRLVIPLARVQDVTVRDHPEFVDVRVVSARVGAASIDIVVPAGSDAEKSLLAAR